MVIKKDLCIITLFSRKREYSDLPCAQQFLARMHGNNNRPSFGVRKMCFVWTRFAIISSVLATFNRRGGYSIADKLCNVAMHERPATVTMIV